MDDDAARSGASSSTATDEGSSPAPLPFTASVDAIERLTYPDVKEAVEREEHRKTWLEMENSLLADHLARLLSRDSTQAPAETVAAPTTVDTRSVTSRTRVRHGRGSLSPAGSDMVPTFLTLGQKCEIVAKESQAIREELKNLHLHSHALITHYKVKLEESELRQADIKRATMDLNKDILVNGINPNTGTIMSEKMLKFFERTLKAKDMAIERYRLNNSTLKSTNRKLLTQLKQKEELGDSLREVDFNQLKIENAEFQEKVEDRNQAMLEVKFLMSITLQLLGQQKLKLQQLTQQSENLTANIRQREEHVARIEHEMVAALQEKEKIGRQVHILKEQLENFRVPDVMDYIREQASVYALAKEARTWQRKVDVAEKSLAIQTLKPLQSTESSPP